MKAIAIGRGFIFLYFCPSFCFSSLTFAVLSQAPGVVIRRKKNRRLQRPKLYLKTSIGIFARQKITEYETHLSAASPPQEIGTWFPQTDADRQWPQSAGQPSPQGA
jgi:hypothetical protein